MIKRKDLWLALICCKYYLLYRHSVKKYYDNVFLFVGLTPSETFKIFYWLLVADFATLMWVGQAPITDPFIALGQLASIYYFSFFFILIPLIGIIETKLVNYKVN